MASLIEIDTRTRTDLPESGRDLGTYQENLRGQFHPGNCAEAILVDQMATAAWRIQRVAAVQNEAVANADPTDSASLLAQLARYESTQQLAFERALKTLLALRKASVRNEPQPVPPAPSSDPALRPAPPAPEESAPATIPDEPERRPREAAGFGPQVLYNEGTASSGSVSDLPESQQCGPRTCLRTYRTSFSAFLRTCEAKAS